MARYDDDDDDYTPPRRYHLAKKPVQQCRDADDWDDDDEDWDDDDDHLDPEVDLLNLLYMREGYHRSLYNNQGRINQLLRQYPELKQRWQHFQRAGGVSAHDFEQFLNGRMRYRIVRSKRHLRLIATRKPIPIKLRKCGNDAA